VLGEKDKKKRLRKEMLEGGKIAGGRLRARREAIRKKRAVKGKNES